MFYEHLTKILKELGVEGTIPKDRPTVTLTVGETPIEITDSPPGIELFAGLGPPPEGEDLEAFYTKLLRGNFLGQATLRAALGLDAEGENVVVSCAIPTVRSYREFRDALEDFVNVVAFWKDEMATNASGI